jgi:hypothetical protein
MLSWADGVSPGEVWILDVGWSGQGGALVMLDWLVMGDGEEDGG